jgi:GTPase SAR1 family protein
LSGTGRGQLLANGDSLNYLLLSTLIDAKLQLGRARLVEIVKSLHDLTLRIGHTDLAETVSDLRDRIFEPFMFVIVGEVKAGKSSFVNALLDTGREIAKAAPQPMTDVIQQILYGPEEQEIVINKYLKKIMLPVDILREIAIVDTPGTNTIVEHHQEITEKFIPSSDLIVFVFEAKNPYRQSAWDFFNYIHEDWKKKIIFVLQQKDLMPPEDLAVNVEGVMGFAKKKGIENPLVFSVSAKQEMEGKKAESGFLPLRKYITQNITGGKAIQLKLGNSIDTATTINHRIADGMIIRRRQFDADQAFRADVRQTLDDQERQSLKQVDLMTENLLLTYDRITRKRLEELRSGLSMFGLIKRSISSTFSSTPSAKNWLDGLAAELEDELNTELRNRLNEGVVDLAESIKQMAHLIDLKLRSSKTILKDDNELFASIAERRENVLRDLRDQFNRFVSRTENFADESLFAGKESLAPNLAAGGGIAAIGVVLMALSGLPVFDITGGVLTSIGILFAGFSTRGKRRKIVEGFEREITQGRVRLGAELEEKLKTYIRQLRSKIEDNFNRFDEMLEREARTLQILEGQQHEIEDQLEKLKTELLA